MKKLFLLFALLAGIAVMTGCKKDQDVVTLQAVVDQESKAYFGNTDRTLPYWDSDDRVKVNGTVKRLTFPGNPITTVATITSVAASDYYCAVYPASVVKEMGIPDENDGTTTATIYFDPHQQYIWENNRQRVNMPMGAVTSNDDKTLIFKNLCSILRLKINNGSGNNFLVQKLTVTSFGGYISGHFDVTLSPSNDPDINASSLNSTSEDNTITVYVPNKAIANNDFEYFDIVVPPFEAEYLILEAELLNTDGSLRGYTSDTVAMASATFTRGPGHSITDEGATTGPVSVPVNQIVTLVSSVTQITDVLKYDYGYLLPGPQFNQKIRTLIGNNTNITTIKFNQELGIINSNHLYEWSGDCGVQDWQGTWYDTVKRDENGEILRDSDGNAISNTPEGWVEVQTSNSPHKIWAYISGDNTVVINSWADFLYANTNSSEMFAYLPSNITNIQWNTTRDYGFQTEDVTDMSFMFAGSEGLTTITSVQYGVNDGSFYLNTTNVTNMAHMFDGCKGLGGLTLTFNTHNVTGNGMVAMFNNCSKLASLNISSFSTERVTNMTEMFNGCVALKDGLNIRHFDMSNVTNTTDMCTNLNANNNTDNRLPITCTIETKEALLGTDASNVDHPETGIDPTKVTWTIVTNN